MSHQHLGRQWYQSLSWHLRIWDSQIYMDGSIDQFLCRGLSLWILCWQQNWILWNHMHQWYICWLFNKKMRLQLPYNSNILRCYSRRLWCLCLQLPEWHIFLIGINILCHKLSNKSNHLLHLSTNKRMCEVVYLPIFCWPQHSVVYHFMSSWILRQRDNKNLWSLPGSVRDLHWISCLHILYFWILSVLDQLCHCLSFLSHHVLCSQGVWRLLPDLPRPFLRLIVNPTVSTHLSSTNLSKSNNKNMHKLSGRLLHLRCSWLLYMLRKLYISCLSTDLQSKLQQHSQVSLQ